MHHLVISNPPHPANWNAAAAAATLELTATEIRTRANYPVPEIWVADSDRADVDRRSRGLRDSGLSVFLIESTEISRIPASAPVRAFTFTERGMVWHVDGGEFEPPLDARLVMIRCQPRQTVQFYAGGPGPINAGRRAAARGRFMLPTMGVVGAMSRAAVSIASRAVCRGEDLDRLTATRPTGQGEGFCDLYYLYDGRLRRITLAQSGLNFTGLGQWMRATARENLEALIGVVCQRWPGVIIDPRMLDLASRQIPVVGVGVPGILEALDPGHRAIDASELSSRLSFLTCLLASE